MKANKLFLQILILYSVLNIYSSQKRTLNSSESYYYDEKYFRILTNNYDPINPGNGWNNRSSDGIGFKPNNNFGSIILLKDWSMYNFKLTQVLFRKECSFKYEDFDCSAEMWLYHTKDNQYYPPGRRIYLKQNFFVIVVPFLVSDNNNPGNDEILDYLNLERYSQTYKNPNIYGNQGQFKPLLDNQLLRQTHWSMGDKTQELPNMYDSTYTRAHTPKKIEKKLIKNVNTFKSSFNINGNGPMIYQTDYRANYIPLSNKINPKEKKIIDDVIKTIKNSHFNLGNMKNDYNTVMNNSYQFNPDEAQNAKGVLDKKLLNDLRSTHYTLGDDNIIKQTTQRRDYIPYNLKSQDVNKPLLQKSHFHLGEQNDNKFQGETIYMSDYIPKDIPKDENECWC